MIAEYADDSAPQVARYEGRIAITTNDGDEAHGFLLKPTAATHVATKILQAVADASGDTSFVHDVEGMELVAGRTTGDGFGMITFTVNGAPLAAVLNATQIAELAAGFTAAARAVDAPDGPRRRDR